MKKTFFTFALGFLLSLSLTASFAADETTNETGNAETSISEEVIEAETQKIQKTEPPKNIYKRSKLTSDRSEMQADRRELILTPGEDKIVDLDFDANAGANGISIGNPKVIATTLVKVGEKRQIVFKPLSAGESTVTIRDTDGTLRLIFDARVAPNNLSRTADELKMLLKDVEGIEIRIVGKKIVIDGDVIVPMDYGRLISVISDKIYADSVINLTTISPITLQKLSQKIQDDIVIFAPNVKTRVVNGQIWLEGTVDSPAAAGRAATVADLYLPEMKPPSQLEKDPNILRLDKPRKVVQNFIVVNAPPPKKQDKLIRITYNFVELSKDYQSIFGFKWQPGFASDPTITVGIGADGQGGGSTTSFVGTISSLFPRLQSAQNAGYARILKTGTFVVQNATPGSLTDQEQSPFAITGPNGQPTTQVQSTGLEFAVTPKILGQGEDIEMQIKMVQSIIKGKTEANAPIVARHTVDTKIYVKSAESAAIAGISNANISTNFNKDDPKKGTFTDADPLFTLLRSKSYTKNKGQFVIFVTPQIIENAAEGTEDLKKNFRVKVK